MKNLFPTTKRELFTRCCDGLATSDELHAMYDTEKEVSYRVFAQNTDLDAIAEQLGYVKGRHAKGLRLRDDYAVRFYRAVFRGVPCYYMDWSAIDHIFLTSTESDAMHEAYEASARRTSRGTRF